MPSRDAPTAGRCQREVERSQPAITEKLRCDWLDFKMNNIPDWAAIGRALSEAACVSSPARAATAASASSASWSPRASPHPATARAPATEPWAAKRLEPSPATEPFAAKPALLPPAATSAWVRLYPGTRRPPTVRVSLGAVWDRPTCRTPPWAPAYSRNPSTAAGLCPCSGPSRARRLFWRRLLPCPRRPSRERPCSTRAGSAAWAGTSWTPRVRAARWTARARPWVPWAAAD